MLGGTMNIAICDDDLKHINLIEDMIYDLSQKLDNFKPDIDAYLSGEELLRLIDVKDFPSILFIDVEMPGLNGIQTARELRKLSEQVLIIYVTSYETYTLESFEVRPFRYLLKPIDIKKFARAFYDAIEYINNSNSYVFFKKGKDHIQIDSSSIISIFSESGRKLRVKTNNELDEKVFYGKIKNIEKELNPLSFVKINSGTIINLKKVKILNAHEVIMIDGSILPISKNRKKSVIDLYSNFISKEVGI
ncbi:DNA-binding response regulator [Finegoldia magna]|uniref:DNA-binding response regulator n=2 Tax=Finegoldia magna TaxID=1260 RepID=A0A2N6SRH7_FINMA|nr:DNA-binding response regulator [Finegoldia magna]